MFSFCVCVFLFSTGCCCDIKKGTDNNLLPISEPVQVSSLLGLLQVAPNGACSQLDTKATQRPSSGRPSSFLAFCDAGTAWGLWGAACRAGPSEEASDAPAAQRRELPPQGGRGLLSPSRRSRGGQPPAFAVAVDVSSVSGQAIRA